MDRIRISQGVGSNPKLWAVLNSRDQVGEFDISNEPGWYGYTDDDGRKVIETEATATGINGMSGIIWAPEGFGDRTQSGVLPRKLYGSVDDWVADVAAEYPDAEIIRADDEPLIKH